MYAASEMLSPRYGREEGAIGAGHILVKGWEWMGEEWKVDSSRRRTGTVEELDRMHSRINA